MGPGDRVEDLDPFEALGVLLAEDPVAGVAIAWVQEAASITTGSSPSPLHPQSRSTISFAFRRWALP